MKHDQLIAHAATLRSPRRIRRDIGELIRERSDEKKVEAIFLFKLLERLPAVGSKIGITTDQLGTCHNQIRQARELVQRHLRSPQGKQATAIFVEFLQAHKAYQIDGDAELIAAATSGKGAGKDASASAAAEGASASATAVTATAVTAAAATPVPKVVHSALRRVAAAVATEKAPYSSPPRPGAGTSEPAAPADDLREEAQRQAAAAVADAKAKADGDAAAGASGASADRPLSALAALSVATTAKAGGEADDPEKDWVYVNSDSDSEHDSAINPH